MGVPPSPVAAGAPGVLLTAVLTHAEPASQPQSTAVWFLVDDDATLRASVTADRQKHKNLRHNPKAAQFIMDPSNSFRTLEVRASAGLEPDPEKSLVAEFAQR